MGIVFRKAFRILGLGERKGRWVMEQDFHGDFQVLVTWLVDQAQEISKFCRNLCHDPSLKQNNVKVNPFAPGDFAEKHVLKLVEWFSGHYRAIKS